MHIRSTAASLITGAVLLLVVVLLGMFYPALTGFDEWLSGVLIATRDAPGITPLALFANDVGGGILGTWVIPVVVALMIVLLRRPWGAAYFLAASIASALFVQIIKNVVARPRPAEIAVHSDFGSFPSGHTANAATAVVALALIFGWRWLVGIGTVWVLFMAWSRITLGAHWPTDTIAGALLGIAIALLVWPIFVTRIHGSDAAVAAPLRG